MDRRLILLVAIAAIHVSTTVAQLGNTGIILNFLSPLESQNGLGWPRSVHVVEGHDALLKLVRPLANQETCLITTARGETFDITSPPSSRFESWGDGNCGVRIRNITEADEGRWKLTATSADHNIMGFSEVHVEDDIAYQASPIRLEDGEANASLNLTMDSNRYCVVHQPFAASSLVPGHCVVTLDKTTRAVQGSWGVDLGLLGRVQEYHVTRHIAVEAEHLDVGFIHDSQTQKLHLYCNILNTHRNVSFCRFQRTSSSAGFNVVDGLSDGQYSYYGAGFLHRECGLTVEHPTAQDFGSWRCSVGVQEFEGTQLMQRSPMQALITVTGSPAGANRVVRTPQRETAIRATFAQRDRALQLTCQADVPLSYCWFQSPDGSQYTPIERSEEGQQFWYSGEGLMVGDCSITFGSAVEGFSGLWTCHMGPNNQVGLEETDRLEVRITGALAANRKEVEATVGGAATLHCHSSSGNRPLDYCRFLTPQFVGINLDATVTQELAILDRFYFTPGFNLDHGDCSLTIDPLREEDFGTWTCAGLVDGEPLEARDTIDVHLPAGSAAPEEESVENPEGREPLSRAGIIGMSVGLPLLAAILALSVFYKYGKPVEMPRMPWRRSEAPSQVPMVNMGRMSVNSVSSGSSSGSSVTNFSA